MTNIIEGMNVINKTPIKEPSWLLFWLCILVGVAVAICGIYLWWRRKNPKTKLGKVFYFVGIIIMMTCLIPMTILSKETGRHTYECTMEDNVSAKYISDNFNIISVEDDIWTIEDKEK